jgi:glycosyltransferase involved in cell wall biosynthesis
LDKIKVIHLVPDLGIGGTQKVVLDICSSADLNRYDVSIFALNKDLSLLPTYSLPPEIKITTSSFEYENDYSLFSYFKHAFLKSVIQKQARDIIHKIVSEKPDILHLHIHPKELLIGIIIKSKINCELVFTQHLLRLSPPSFSLKLLGMISRRTFRKYNIIAVSSSIYEEVIEYKLKAKDKLCTVIENKLNLNLFVPASKLPKDYISVVYVARIGHPKGHRELIEAWSKAYSNTVRKKLFLIGPDGLNNEIHQLVKNIIKDDSVVFMGTQYQISSILNECDFAVFPSFREGLPIALLEKMAMQLPVIVSDIPELTGIIKDNVNGLIFKCGDTDELAAKINLLAADPELRIRLGKNARKTVEEKFGSSNIALANEIFYQKVLQSKRIH